MVKNEREFCEEEASKILQVYETFDDVRKKNPTVNLYDHKIRYADIQAAMCQSIDFVTQKPKNYSLDMGSITDEDVNKITAYMNNSIMKASATITSKENDFALISAVKVTSIPQVKFINGKMGKDRDGKPIYLAPRFVINVSKADIKPNCGVRINTGYVVKIPNKAKKHSIVDNKIIVGSKDTIQPKIVIVPLFFPRAGLIPTIYARDSEDTGLYTINFTTTEKFDPTEPIRVFLGAYVYDHSLTSTRLIGDSSSSSSSSAPKATIFKPKDLRSNRYVRNLKVKFVSDSCTLDKTMLNFNTIDEETSVVLEERKLQFDDIITLFSSRKREWCNPQLLTLSGIFDPRSKAKQDVRTLIAPKIAPNSDYLKKNTHCVTFLKNQVTLFSVSDEKLSSEIRILNGAASDLKNYSDVVKFTRSLINSMMSLSSGAKDIDNYIADRVKSKITPPGEFENLLRYYDHHKKLDIRETNLVNKSCVDEKSIYDTRPKKSHAHSVMILKLIKQLSAIFLPHLFTKEQLDELNVCCNANSNKQNEEEEQQQQQGIKRKAEDDDNDDDVKKLAM